MDTEAQKKYLKILDSALEDEEYRRLYELYGKCIGRFQLLLKQLPPEQAEVIYDYIDLCALMHVRILELACQC